MALLHDRTGRPGPATWELGDYPDGQGDHPVTGVSWYEAAAYAAFVGKELPTTYQWSRAAGTYAAPQIVPASNFRQRGHGPGRHPRRHRTRTAPTTWPATPRSGAGTRVKDGRRFILGGGWNEPSYMFNDADAQDPFTRGPSFGFRLVEARSTTDRPRGLRGHPARPPRLREREAGAARGRAGVPAPLRLRQAAPRCPGRGDRRQRGSLAEGEGQLHRRLRRRARHRLSPDPANADAPRIPLVVLFPGSNAIHERSSKTLPGMRLLSPILRSGRAVLYPVFKSTFERGDALDSDYQAPTAFYRDHVIMWSRDLGRSHRLGRDAQGHRRQAHRLLRRELGRVPRAGDDGGGGPDQGRPVGGRGARGPGVPARGGPVQLPRPGPPAGPDGEWPLRLLLPRRGDAGPDVPGARHAGEGQAPPASSRLATCRPTTCSPRKSSTGWTATSARPADDARSRSTRTNALS